ncbi:hypothetical protein SAMN05519103_07006 [Rhizobiales bacterium GAS113]|nr:hypothetical protein SAMN05519103_07006 [Rhizobiales bacterium GAS113]
MRSTSTSNFFILEAFDREQWCAVLQQGFNVPDVEKLRGILGQQSEDDPELEHMYILDADDLATIFVEFGVSFDPSRLGTGEFEIHLFRRRGIQRVPYLIHTGYELPLLLDGRKKLAKMYHEYPPMTFDGEDKFDRWVSDGKLHKEVTIELFEKAIKKFIGIRTCYYTSKGEEWRIPASKFIWQAAQKSGGWNEYYERLEGMLFGYEDWQNDWWFNHGLENGRFAGIPLCCAVTAAGLAWIEAAGFRALPPIERPAVAIMSFDVTKEAEMRALMFEDPDSVALVRFNLGGGAMMQILDIRGDGPWLVPRERIPELNSNLLRPIVIIERRQNSS